MAHKTLLFLGAGSNVGASSVALFKSKGYKVASVARTIRDEVKAHSDMVLSADFSDPSVFKGIFEKVEKELGIPNVVIYNRKIYFYISSGLSFYSHYELLVVLGVRKAGRCMYGLKRGRCGVAVVLE